MRRTFVAKTKQYSPEGSAWASLVHVPRIIHANSEWWWNEWIEVSTLLRCARTFWNSGEYICCSVKNAPNICIRRYPQGGIHAQAQYGRFDAIFQKSCAEYLVPISWGSAQSVNCPWASRSCSRIDDLISWSLLNTYFWITPMLLGRNIVQISYRIISKFVSVAKELRLAFGCQFELPWQRQTRS